MLLACILTQKHVQHNLACLSVELVALVISFGR